MTNDERITIKAIEGSNWGEFVTNAFRTPTNTVTKKRRQEAEVGKRGIGERKDSLKKIDRVSPGQTISNVESNGERQNRLKLVNHLPKCGKCETPTLEGDILVQVEGNIRVDIRHCKVFGSHFVVYNSIQDQVELLKLKFTTLENILPIQTDKSFDGVFTFSLTGTSNLKATVKIICGFRCISTMLQWIHKLNEIRLLNE